MSMNNTMLGLIEIAGIDAAKFLQGQLTCNVQEVNSQQHRLGAHCDPKGRIQATFRLFQHQENYYFLLPQSVIPHLLQCLNKYAVFSKVKLTEISTSELLDQFMQILWPEQDDWVSQDIIAGSPTIYPETIGEFTPHQINLQLINGVSFNKGCYTGQEIVARMHYLGKLKQQMYRVSFVSQQTPVAGMKFYNAEQQEVGTLVMAAQTNEHQYQALAVLQTSVIESPIHLTSENNAILTLLNLPYTI